ncbi:hypothetical protein GYM62_10395 [Algoriphagus sp. NBT04N3]|jgi:hypothetical protein|uniref:hypothetical protein n=1 Tax=Algoriphagus sp. NBT04N3 TaxID=2705473 RepID=UPI001C62B5A2|nr:hypothetical protein [Algoriphagus sp. NBT04N3]QYH39182.1 hypothetical protein GYM62_10395 [Algoriphagus sp. NBT04N3]
MFKKRCVIYPKDVQLITGRSERYGHSLLSKIRKFYRKKSHQYVTLDEFSEFSGIPLEEVEKYIG